MEPLLQDFTSGDPQRQEGGTQSHQRDQPRHVLEQARPSGMRGGLRPAAGGLARADAGHVGRMGCASGGQPGACARKALEACGDA